MASPKKTTVRSMLGQGGVIQDAVPYYDLTSFDSERPVSTTVPLISSINAVTSTLSVVQVITEGAELRLNSLPDPFNITAVSSDEENTGSVGFVLELTVGGVTTVVYDRIETYAPYTMQQEANTVEMAEGDYELRVTPYSGISGTGSVGTTVTRTFSVIDDRDPDAFSADISRVLAGSCQITDGEDTCISLSEYSATTDNAAGTIQYQWTVDNSELEIINGTSTAQNVQLRSVSDSSVFGNLTLTVTDGTDVISVTLQTVHVHSSIGGSTEGFTDNSPLAGAQAIYVANSGSDSSSGSIANPVATITHALSLMDDDAGDRVYLNCGDEWIIENNDLNGMEGGYSSAGRSLITYYGDTSLGRPKILGESTAYRTGPDIAHFGFIGVHFYGYKKDPANVNYDADADAPDLRFISSFEDILIEDCIFGFTKVTAELYNGNPDGIIIRRNIFDVDYAHGSSSSTARGSNIYAAGAYNLLLEGNVFDYGGWHPDVAGAGGNKLSHNVYLQYNVDGATCIVRDNIFARPASHGIQLRGGGVLEDNFFWRCGIGFSMGYQISGSEVPAGVNVHALYNVVTEGESQYKGVDFCEISSICTKALWAWEMVVASDADYKCNYNIASKIYEGNYEQDGYILASDKEDFANGYSLASSNYEKIGNVTYQWESDTEGTNEGYSDPDRNLGEYNTTLGGSDSGDEFMTVAKSRPIGAWWDEYTATYINAYIQAGVGITR